MNWPLGGFISAGPAFGIVGSSSARSYIVAISSLIACARIAPSPASIRPSRNSIVTHRILETRHSTEGTVRMGSRVERVAVGDLQVDPELYEFVNKQVLPGLD